MGTSSSTLQSKYGRIVIAGIAAYVTLLCWACHAKFSAYAYGDFDLAHHSQSVWNILHGSLDSSILGIPFLGNHMAIILFLIAPLYLLFPSPLLLLYLQTLALGIGAWWIFMLARRELSEKWAAGLSLVYLIYSPLIYLNLYEFHPIALAVPFVTGMLYCYKAQRFRPFLILLLLALSCQENVALISVAFAFYALADRKRGLWFRVPLAVGIIYFWFAVIVIMPRLNNNTVQFIRLYGHLGESLPEVLRNAIVHPFYTLRFMFTAEKVVFLNALLGPVAYLSLLSPLSLLPASLVLVQRLLSIRASEATVVYHYQAEMIPFVFFAAIYGIKRLLKLKHRIIRPALGAALVFFPLASLLAGGTLPALYRALSSPSNNSFVRSRKDFVMRNLPNKASVLATFEFLPRLANRRKVYSLHHVYTGRYTLSDVPYPLPDVDYIIMDTNDPLTFSNKGFYGPDNYKRIQAVLTEPGWRLIEHVDSLLVFKRDPGIDIESLDMVEYIDQPMRMNRNIRQTPAADIQLLGFEIGLPDKPKVDIHALGGSAASGRLLKQADIVDLTLYWEKTLESGKDYDMHLTVTAGMTIIYRGRLSPGSRIWPPQSWQTGKVIVDRHRVHLDRKKTSLDNIEVRIELLPLEETDSDMLVQ